MKHISRHTGFTLVEVLVTVFILAIGLLGLSGLQLSALQSSTTAYERSQASMLAYEIIDKMRANRDSMDSYIIALDTTPVAPSKDCFGTTAANVCTSAEMAAYDLAQWRCSLGKWRAQTTCTNLAGGTSGLVTIGKLSNGDGAISIDANRIVTVSIQWEENRGETAAADKLTTIQVITLI